MNRFRYPRTSGQELIEFALILPIFALIIFGIFDLGRAVYYYSAMSNAAREGARYGSIHLEEADLDTTICNRVINWSVAVPLTCVDVNTVLDFNTETVVVTVTYPFQPVTPFIANLFGSPTVDLTARSTMFLEYVPLN
jgi:Flp pilus assembly protein TadG